MLRLLIGIGLLLMSVGFGAAGWQYWQSLPADAASAAAEAAGASDGLTTRQTWLVSPTGGLIPLAEVRAYLDQERFVPGRSATITRSAPLTDLLIQGETLPEAPYLQVLADIRAPKLAEGLCAVLTTTIARECALNSARVVEGSVDPVLGTARFRIELVYRLKTEAEELPDLAAHVLEGEMAVLQGDGEGSESVKAALEGTITAALSSCGSHPDGQACRILRLALDWTPGRPALGQAEVVWLSPLPDGMFTAPPLEPAPEG